jgi:hypothetical protein
MEVSAETGIVSETTVIRSSFLVIDEPIALLTVSVTV